MISKLGIRISKFLTVICFRMLKDKNFLACLFFALLGIIFSVVFFNYPIHDYGNYYFGSKFALQGVSVKDIYEPYKFNLLIRELPVIGHQKFFMNYAVVPPFTLLFYIPFTFLDMYVSKFLFNVISVLAFCLMLFKLLRHLKIESQYIFFLPIIFIIPFRNNILFGQTYLLITSFLMAGFLAEEKKKSILSAAFYALAIALKISPAVLLIYLLVRKKFRVAILTVLFTSALFLSAVYFTEWNFLFEYIFSYVPRMSINEINNPWATTYQSFFVLLKNLFIPDQLLNPDAPLNSPPAFNIIIGIISGLLFFFLIKQLTKKLSDLSALGTGLLFSFLLTAYTSNYSLVMLLPLAISGSKEQPTPKLFYSLILLFLICSIPVAQFQSLPLLLRFPRLYLLIMLFFTTVSFRELVKRDFLWLGLSILFFALIKVFSTSVVSDKSDYYLREEASLLSYDFDFRDHKLFVKCLDEKGSQEKEIPINDSVSTIQNLSLRNNQLFFSGQMTFGNDRKLKPLLVNGKEIIYLSDKNRGIGFYTLRKFSVK